MKYILKQLQDDNDHNEFAADGITFIKNEVNNIEALWILVVDFMIACGYSEKQIYKYSDNKEDQQ